MSKLWNIFKQKVDSSATSMQDGDWSKMEAMLNSDPKFATRSGAKKWGLISVALFAVVSSSAYLISNAQLKQAHYSPRQVDNEITNVTSNAAISNSNVEVISNQEIEESRPPAELSKEISSTEGEVLESKTVIPQVENTTSQLTVKSDEASGMNQNRASSATSKVIAVSSVNESAEIQVEVETPAEEEFAQGVVIPEVESNASSSGSSSKEAEIPAEIGEQEEQLATNPEPLNNEVTRIELPDDVSTEDAFEEVEEPKEEEVGEDEVSDVADSNSEDSPVISTPYNRSAKFMVDATYGYGSAFNTSFNSQELGLELGYEKGGWTVQTGLQWVNTTGDITRSFDETVVIRDTSFVPQYHQYVDTSVIKTWVITGYYTGTYVYDTTYNTVVDTIIVAQVDTSEEKVTRYSTSHIQTSYLQIPLTVGYTWSSGRWGYGVQAGMNIRRVTYLSDEYEATSQYGFDALIRPTVTYEIADHWHVLMKSSFTMPLSQDPLLNSRNFARFGVALGVRYSW